MAAAGKKMFAVVTTGHGGFERLVYKQVPIPILAAGEVLVQVLAAGVNNTDINTRLGWYSKTVSDGTQSAQELAESRKSEEKEDGGWNGTNPFPLIQGTDCCGRVVEICDDFSKRQLLGKRVLIRPCMRGTDGFASMDMLWMASEINGAFAQFVKVPASEVFPVDCDWSDAELGSIPCAYGTAENMLDRAAVEATDHVIVPGSSGGVGSAVVQLAKRRGARVTAICGASKSQQLISLGADTVLVGRHGSVGWNKIVEQLADSADVVLDNVGGASFGDLLGMLRRGGRYITSGAISGPIVPLDLRTLYLRDLRLLGSTAWDQPCFPNLIRYIENGEIQPCVHKVFPLHQIIDAQRLFMEKKHVGKIVLVPDRPSSVSAKL